MRYEEIPDAFKGTGPRNGIDAQDHSQHNEHRHHDAGYALYSILNAHQNDKQYQQRKNQEPELGRYSVRDKSPEKCIRGHH